MSESNRPVHKRLSVGMNKVIDLDKEPPTPTQVVARKLIQVLADQKPGDIDEIRKLAVEARNLGEERLAENAEAIASTLEEGDRL